MFGMPLEIPEGLPNYFRITTDKSFEVPSDVIVFHLPSLSQIPYEYKPADQVWVAWCMESDVNYPFLKNKEVMGYFDIKMTYRLDSEVPCTYLYKRYQQSFRNNPKKKTKYLNAFISSTFNQSGRLEYFKELMQHLEIDSYGKVFNNCRLQGDDKSHKAKESLIANYQFTIAFENSISQDYVTEKFFQPLAAGSIPIYLGAPNVDDFAPGDKCYINVNDFESPKKLALYIKKLQKDNQQYQEYFEWKKQPFRPGFTRLLEQQRKHPFIRLCNAIDEFYKNK